MCGFRKGRRVIMVWQTLNDPPLPGELQSWAKAREVGRQWYIWRGVLTVTIAGLVLLFAVATVWFFVGGFDFTIVILIPIVYPVAGWVILRHNWAKNESIYAKSDRSVENPAAQH